MHHSLETTAGATSPMAAFLVHPIKVARLCETLSMLALTRIHAGHDVEASKLLDLIDGFVRSAPALSHPVDEEWMFSVLVTATALAAGGHTDTAIDLTRQTTVWLLDWIESGLQLSAPELPLAVVNALLVTAYMPPRAPANDPVYSFAVMADLAGLLGGVSSDLYADIIRDLDALRAMATVKVPRGQ